MRTDRTILFARRVWLMAVLCLRQPRDAGVALSAVCR